MASFSPLAGPVARLALGSELLCAALPLQCHRDSVLRSLSGTCTQRRTYPALVGASLPHHTCTPV